MQRQQIDVGCVERDCFPNLRKSALLRNCNKLLDTSYLRYQRRQTPGLVTSDYSQLLDWITSAAAAAVLSSDWDNFRLPQINQSITTHGNKMRHCFYARGQLQPQFSPAGHI